MARFDRIKVYSTMRATAIIPVFYHKDPQAGMDVVKACYAGGARVFEFTNRGDFAYDVFAELNRFIIREMPDMILGVGSVVDGPTAALYIQAGTNFIVSPSLKEDMAIVCNRRKIPWIPGCGSVNEISRAEELGAEVVKIFPAGQVGGPAFIKNIKGPCPWTSIMPTGGVEPTEENLKAWFEAGAYCVGMGSKLMVKDPDGKFDLKGIEEMTRKAIQIASRYIKA
ncbi:MAG: bifunctional 4-hydroxy-2-oxoglutarate aldolase/2-dehydro-3-deoxy-phosphogluconate aldolase [Cyclobacteriaceae bacterium]|nr:bifunctional 4-hydroxy-2-oxoglutarate aldolase/2-dehydro-3-deoxy-phosphogluconate aldolase [Cyclobacteriaceae bacterium]